MRKLNTTWAAVAFSCVGQFDHRRMLQHLGIRGEQRESLIDNLAFSRQNGPHFAIPAQAGEAAILHECRQFVVRPFICCKCSSETLLTPSRRVRPASRSFRIASQTSASASVHS